MAERFVTETIHDKTLDVSLRPGLFADFAGQTKVKERLELAVAAKLVSEVWTIERLIGEATK